MDDLKSELTAERFRNVCRKQEFFAELRRDYMSLFFKVLTLGAVAAFAVLSGKEALGISTAIVKATVWGVALAIAATGAFTTTQMFTLEGKIKGYRRAEAEIGKEVGAPAPDDASFRRWSYINAALVGVPSILVLCTALLYSCAELRPAEGLLAIESTPPADVWIDGRYVGTTPAEGLSIPAGSRRLRFEAKGHDALNLTIDVLGGARQRVNAQLPAKK